MDIALEQDLSRVLSRLEKGLPADAEWLRRTFPATHARIGEMLALSSMLAPRRLPAARVGPFRLLRLLGDGGTGSVYLARCEATNGAAPRGARVALKVFHAELVRTPAAVERVRCEAATGSRVRHANVLRTLGAMSAEIGGEERHLLVLEHVEGQTLRALMEEIGPLPEALCRRVGRDVARGLAAVHAAGVIHCDVKPENVLLAADGTVRLMDLGVACAVDEARRRVSDGRFAGSVLYAAPEQLWAAGRRAAPRDVDGRADLYALGLVLVEAAHGAHPFADAPGDGPPARAPRLSPFFTALTASLLERDPAERPDSARHVAAALDRGEESAWWSRRRAAAPSTPSALTSHVTAFRGRRTELRLLRETWHRALDGEGATIVIEGIAGAGKSRLVDAALDVLSRVAPGSRVVVARHGPIDGAREPEALLRALRSAAGPRVASRLARRAEAAGTAGPDPRRASSLVRMFVLSLARRGPLVLVAEDMHFMSAWDLAALAAASRASRGRRVLVIATTRPIAGAAGAGDPQIAGAAHLRLGPLPDADIRGMLTDAFRSDPLGRDLAADVAPSVGGSPFLALEVVRELERAGEVAQLPDGSWVRSLRATRRRGPAGVAAIVPATVGALVGRRIEELTTAQRRLLGIAACCGPAFDAALVARAAELPEVHVHRELARIAAGGELVVARGAGFAFAHHIVQEGVRARLPDAQRRAIHRGLGRALAARAVSAGDAAAETAAHLLASDCPAEAGPHLAAALDHHAAAGRPGVVVALARAALDAPGVVEGAARAAVLIRCAAALRFVGAGTDHCEVFREAVRVAEPLGDPILLLSARRMLAEALDDAEMKDEAASLALAVLQDAKRLGCKAEAARATGALASIRVAQGATDEGLRLFDEQLALGREAGDDEAVATAEVWRGQTLLIRGDLRAARTALSRGRDATRRLGLARAHSTAVGWLGAAELQSGRFDAAEELFAFSLRLAKNAGDRNREGGAWRWLSLSALARGLAATALKRVRVAVSVAEETQQIDDAAGGSITLASALLALGDLGAARAESDRALIHAERAGRPDTAGFALVRRADAARELGDAAAAAEDARRAVEIGRTQRRPRLESEARCVLARVQLADGDRSAALASVRADPGAPPRRGLVWAPAKVLRLHLAGRTADALALLRRVDTRLEHRERVRLRADLVDSPETGGPAHTDAETLRREAATLIRITLTDGGRTHRDSILRNLRASRIAFPDGPDT